MSVVVQESVRIAAPPMAVYAAVGDPANMPRWSPECERVTVRGRVTGPAPVGTRFSGRNRTAKNRPWSTSCLVTVSDPAREFTFRVQSLGLPIAEWRYTFAPDPEGPGTTVTESCADLRGRLMNALGTFVSGVRDRDTHNRENIRTTLDRLKAQLEQAG